MAEQADYFQMASSSPAEGLLERYPELFDSDGTLIRRLQARHSRIEEFRARGHRSNVIVKTITVSSSAEHAARVAGEEFAALTWLRKHLDSSLRDTVPEPLAWIPGTQTVAMRKLDGVTVGRLLRRHAVHGAFWSGGRLARIGAQVGGWLRAFHDATRAPAQVFDGDRLLAELDRVLEGASAQQLPAAAAARIRQQAQTAVLRLRRTPVPYAARQGDFTVSNILIDGPHVRIVDFENFRSADAIYEDVSSLASYLRMAAHGPVYARRRLERMRRAFLEAYGQPDDDPVLALYELKQALAVLMQLPARESRLARLRRRGLIAEVVGLGQRLELEVVPYARGASGYRDAASYDSLRYHGTANEYKREVMKVAYTGLVGPAHGLRVLDVGCGTGRGLADLAGTGARLFGSDASLDMLAQAKRAQSASGAPRLTASNAQHLPFAAGSFDIVVSLNFLHLFRIETQREMVAEMKRVVKPGGRLILEFDNALHGILIGPFKRWTGRETGSLPSEIRRVIGDGCSIRRRRGAVYPLIWRVLSRWPQAGARLEKLAFLPGLRVLAHRVYYEVQTAPEAPPSPSTHRTGGGSIPYTSLHANGTGP